MKPILLGLVFLCVGLVAPRAWGADYRIGMIAPLSGPKSDRGVPMRNAVELFVEQLNKRGGIFGTRMQLVVEDDLDDPARAREGAQRLAADPSVLAIIGHYYPGPASGAVSVYDKEQIPCISPNVGAPEVLRASPWMFTTTVADEEQGSFLAVYLKAVLKRDNVLVVHTADPFGESLRAAFARKAVAIGLTVVQTLSVENRALPPDWVVRSIPDIADRAGIGAVAALTHSEPGLSLVPQLRDVGITAPIVAPSTWTNPKFLTQDEAVLGELYVASPLLWELANEKATRFAEAYRKTYGESPTVAAAMAYDSALLIAEGLTRLAAPESKTPRHGTRCAGFSRDLPGKTR